MNEDIPIWHTLPTERALNLLAADEKGLTSEEADRRLASYGANELPEPRARGPVRRFVEQFNNILIYVLFMAGAVTALLGEWLDAGVIFGVILVNAFIGFIQEGKAVDALRGIRQLLSPQALVLRDAKSETIAARQVVPGDVVILQAGDKVVADLRLIQCKNLQLQEAALTGESTPVEKSSEAVAADAPLADRQCMAFSGTLVTTGQGIGVVVDTGQNTEIGRIGALVAGVEPLSTPLLRQMSRFGRRLTAIILLISVAVFAFGICIRAYPATDMFMAVVGLAVAAIPEGLPAIMTITLAIGVQRMARRHAIIRRLPAVETLGSVSIICTDKTGTLTRNEMTVRTLVTADSEYAIEGSGYEVDGAFRLSGEAIPVDDHPLMLDALRAGLLCNDASLAPQQGCWLVNGDPMEGALLVAAAKAGQDQTAENQQFPRLDLIPFAPEYRFMATLHQGTGDNRLICVKGAPEQILQMCARQRDPDGESAIDLPYWQSRITDLAAQGQRLLAVAVKQTAGPLQSLNPQDVAHDLVLVGLLGLIDPPRIEAIEALLECQSAGIEVKMITGDHRVTAAAIARQLGFTNCKRILTGQELEKLSDDQLRLQLGEVDVYARVNPEHKLRLVHLLQEQGAIVAMTGDGVNDAPALKRADIGIAMGVQGTEAAKEAAEVVLADDNFASIVDAVEEGRTVYDNLRKAILFILPTSGGEALIIVVAVLLGFQQLPLTPVQILWVNMVTTVTLALALAFEPAEADIMQRSPRPPTAPLLSKLLVWRVIFVSLILTAGTFGVYWWALSQQHSIAHARTAAVNTLVLFECFYLFNARYIAASAMNFAGFFGNRWVLLAIGVLLLLQLAFTYAPPLQTLFGTEVLSLTAWSVAATVAASVLVLVELEKYVVRRRKTPPQSRADTEKVDSRQHADPG